MVRVVFGKAERRGRRSRVALGLIAALVIGCGEDLDPTFVACGPGWAPQDMPLFVTHDVTTRDFHAAITEAVKIWNDAVTGLLLDGGLLDVDLATGSTIGVIGVDSDRGEAAIWHRDCEVIRAEIRIPFDSPRQVRRLAHELGHVLRLAHDDDLDSVMHPDSTLGGESVADNDAIALGIAYFDL